MFQSLKLHNFRNYERESIELHPGVNVVIGDNGRGKTNLLEALFLLVHGRSMRAVDNKEMVRKGEEGALVEGVIDIGGEKTVRIQISGEGSIRGRKSLQNTRAVSFQPDDIWIVKGGPEARRKYLDEAIESKKKGYRETIREYQRVLKQRNEAIRAVRKGEKGKEYIRNWNPMLYERGREIVGERNAVVQTIQEETTGLGRSWGIRGINLKYYTSMGENIGNADSTIARIERMENAEIRRGTTLTGPHRDELSIHQEERSARRECSQGEQKLLAIILRIAQAKLLERDAGGEVLLLMDDCLSELDRGNREILMKELNKWPQVAVTTTDDAEELDRSWKIWLE